MLSQPSDVATGIVSSLNVNKGNGFFFTTYYRNATVLFTFGMADPVDGKHEVIIGFGEVDLKSWNHFSLNVNYNGGNPSFTVYINKVLLSSYSKISYSSASWSGSHTARSVLVFGNLYADIPDSRIPHILIDEFILFNYTIMQYDVDILYGMY